MLAQDMIKGIEALEELLKELNKLQKDAVIFIAEKGLHEEFLEYHAEQHLKRTQERNEIKRT